MNDVEDELRAIEKERLAAFVAKDIDTLQRLHADDYQLINPGGRELTKREYLSGIEGGMIDYRLWEADSPIEVRVFGDAAAMRYRALIEVAVQGELQPRMVLWLTDIYEKHDGRWQVVWSQETRSTS